MLSFEPFPQDMPSIPPSCQGHWVVFAEILACSSLTHPVTSRSSLTHPVTSCNVAVHRPVFTSHSLLCPSNGDLGEQDASLCGVVLTPWLLLAPQPSYLPSPASSKLAR